MPGWITSSFLLCQPVSWKSLWWWIQMHPELLRWMLLQVPEDLGKILRLAPSNCKREAMRILQVEARGSLTSENLVRTPKVWGNNLFSGWNMRSCCYLPVYNSFLNARLNAGLRVYSSTNLPSSMSQFHVLSWTLLKWIFELSSPTNLRVIDLIGSGNVTYLSKVSSVNSSVWGTLE